jgi:cytochrome c peroxidase
LVLITLLTTIVPSSIQRANAADMSADFDRRAVARIKSPPLGLAAVPVPSDNPVTAEKVALGRKLFFDRRLSHNRTMSCGMCHVPEQGFTNNEMATPIGVEGRSVRRNAPASYNVAYLETMFHDARDTSLETQIFGPLLAHNEMANPSIGFVLETIRGAPDYDGMFEAAFGERVNVRSLGLALASYERTLLSGNSAFDRWKFGGDEAAVAGQVKRGFELFTGKAGCAACHLIGNDSALLTDHALHNTGIGYLSDMIVRASKDPVAVEIAPGVVVAMARKAVVSVGLPRPRDRGRMEVTNDPADLYHFKTPSLRNVALTAPYMHDGSLPTLEDVVLFYNRGGHSNLGLDPLVRPLGLTGDDVGALVAFLESLTGDNVAELRADARSVAIGN